MIQQTDPALKRMREDFRYFMRYAWRYLGLPQPTWVQYSMAQYLQHGPRRRGILGFRGVAKSTITQAFVVWLLWRDPNIKIMVVSAAKDRADDFTTFVLNLIDLLPICKHLKPRPEEGQRFSRVSFDVGPATPANAPSVKSRGIGSAITGSRADYIIADDIEITNNSLTQTMRDKISHNVKEFDAILKPGGHIVYLGTPQTQQTIYKTLMGRGYDFKVWPVMFPTKEQIGFYGDLLAPAIRLAVEQDDRLAGQPTDPLRFNRQEIAERLLSYGPVEFARQFMLDTRLADAEKHPLRLHDLIFADLNTESAFEKYLWASGPGQIIEGVSHVGLEGDRIHRPLNWTDPQGNPPRMLPYQGRVMAIDPSGRGKDETAYAILYMLHGMLFLMDVGGLRGGYSDENLEKLALIAKQYKVNNIVVESNFGDGMFLALLVPFLRKHWPVSTEEVRHNIQKEKRILDTLEPVVHQHRLVVDQRLLSKDMQSTADYGDEDAYAFQFFFQFTRLTRDRGSLRHDDRVDVVSMAVAHFVEQIGKDVDVAAMEAREALRDQAMREFMDRVERKEARRSGWQDNWAGGVIPTCLQN